MICNFTSPMLLNLQMLADPMETLMWEFSSYLPNVTPTLNGCVLYCGQEIMTQDTVYLVPEDACDRFPADQYAYITTGDLDGHAPHICVFDQPFPNVANQVMTTFQRYRSFEISLGSIIADNGTLTDLCRLASDFFQNPVYIHDDLFSVLAVSHKIVGMLDFEYNEKSGKVHIPLWLINEFKFNESYCHTLTLHHAAIWGNDQYPYSLRSLFVNLWNDTQYCGRVLVNEIRTVIQPGQFWALEYFARYALTLLLRLEQSQMSHRSFEETLVSIISGSNIDKRDLHTMMSILDWSESDPYLCLVLQEQDPSTSIRSSSALNSLLSPELNGSISFFYQQQLCVVVNVKKCDLDPRTIRTHLAPQIRDSYMYGGFSNPLKGILSLRTGYMQAAIALNYIMKEDSSNWLVSFSSCALSYIRECSNREFPAAMLVHPAIQELRTHDKNTGTQYYETLRAYLICERNIPLTSSTLIIHRTTLTYRLEKIMEMTNLNLDDADLRLYLLISFHILDHDENRFFL